MLNKCWHKRFSVSNIMPMSVLLRMFYLQAMALCLLNGGGRTGVAYKLRHWSRSLPEHSTSIPSSLAQVATLSSKRFFGNSIRSLLLVGGTASLSFPSKTSQNAVAATTLSSKQSILKRASDNREYKALTLDNGMRVLLISDIACTRAAAAVDVHVGSFSDPAELPGLAHFCEHMSFLGTQKYPDEDDFSNYLAEHGGSSNAYTDSEDTVYFFDVNADHLTGALDRFAQFFITPLFTDSATSRELNAVESEHAKNINNDGFRLYQLERDSSNPIHPLNKFSTGNKETLETIPLAKGIDVRKSLLAFHEKYYSSNIMTMAVEGKESLAELEQIVRQKFSAVPNRAAEDPTKEWWGKIQPYAPQASASILEVVPIGESRTIKVSWPIWVLSPAERANIHYLKPEAVISHLLGHEGEGSLRSLLVHKGWCNGLQSYVGNDISDLQMFEISIDLTPDGFKSRYEVVDAVFAFIDLIKINLNRGLPDYIIDELKQLSKMSFEYAEKSEPADYVSDLVANMQQYKNPTEYLAGSRLFTRFDSDFTAKYLSELTPENSRLEVVSGEFSGETSQVGRYYGTHYNGFSSSELTQRWKKISASTYPELILPKANAFIPHNFQIYSKSAPPKTEIERVRRLRAPPKLITSNKHWDLWYKLDDVFKQPKVYAIFQLAVAKDLYTPQFVMNSKIFSICLTEKLAEFLYEARLGGLDFSLDFTSRGVQITVSGFNDKFAYFFHKVLHYLAEFTPDEVLFRRVQEVMKRELDSWKTQQPYSHASYYTGLAIESLQFTIEQMKEALESCSSAGVGKFLKQALHKSRGTAMIIGNIKEEDARSATAEINKVFAFETLEIDKQSRREITILEKKPNGGLLLKHQEPNSNDANSAAIFYFQLASRDPSLYTYLNLLNEIVEQAFYNSLRTKQQLGYIVYSGVSVKQDVRFLTLAAQSSTVSGEELVDRIAEFLETELPNLLEELTSDEFHGYKEGITTRILEPDQRLTQQASRFWSEILSGTKLSTEPNNQTPMFDRAIVEAQSIDKIDLSDFREFVKNHILEGGKMRRLLVSEIDSKQKIITTVEKGVPSTKRKYSHLLDYISNEQLFAESAEKI